MCADRKNAIERIWKLTRGCRDVLCSSVCPLNSRHQRKGNVDRLFLQKRKAAKKRGIAQWFDLIGAETRQASESCRFPYLLLVRSFTMLRECNCVWICFCTHFFFPHKSSKFNVFFFNSRRLFLLTFFHCRTRLKERGLCEIVKNPIFVS